MRWEPRERELANLCGVCGRVGHFEWDCTVGDDPLIRDAENAITRCEWCSEFGHGEESCPKRLAYKLALDVNFEPMNRKFRTADTWLTAVWFVTGVISGLCIYFIAVHT